MWRKLFIVTLFVSFVGEILTAAAGFVAPVDMLTAARIGITPDTLFLGTMMSWLILLVALVCGIAFVLARRNQITGWTLSYLLGGWWTLVGLALSLGYGRHEHLIVDTAKGLLILLSAFKCRPNAKSTHQIN